jgi:succinoglycan biosynthesis protein ExoM
MSRQRCVISVCTYARPDMLQHLLKSLSDECIGLDYRVVVVENDDSGSAREVAESFGAEYASQPIAGISAARNKCLDLLSEDDDFVVFVDDDEVVEGGWLQEMLRVQSAYDADVVTGPVITIYPPDAPTWIVKGGFMQRKRYETGHLATSVATNNTLVRADVIRSLGIRFDTAFSFSGGGDTDFFRRMRPSIKPPVWADDAVVTEVAPINRLNLNWQTRRAFRNGSVTARIQLRTKSRVWILAHSIFSVGNYSVRFVLKSIQLRAPSGQHYSTVIANVGRIAELFSFRTADEYGR